MKRIQPGPSFTGSSTGGDLHGYSPEEQARILRGVDRRALPHLRTDEQKAAFFARLRANGVSAVSSAVEVDAAVQSFLEDVANAPENPPAEAPGLQPSPGEEARPELPQEAQPRSFQDLALEREAAAKLDVSSERRVAAAAPASRQSYAVHVATEAMFSAIESGSLADFEEAIAQGAQPWSFLAWANPVEDADLNSLARLSDQLLGGATGAGAFVGSLIENLRLESHPPRNGYNALTFACLCGRSDFVRRLCAFRPLVNGEDGLGCTPLKVALASGSADCVEALVENGADVNLADRRGRTPLAVACGKGDAAAVRRLLELGAQPICASRRGDQPLSLALNALADRPKDAELRIACERLLAAVAADLDRATALTARDSAALVHFGSAWKAVRDTIKSLAALVVQENEFSVAAAAALERACASAAAGCDFIQRYELKLLLRPLASTRPDLAADLRADLSDLQAGLAAVGAASAGRSAPMTFDSDGELQQSAGGDRLRALTQDQGPLPPDQLGAIVDHLCTCGNLKDLSWAAAIVRQLPEAAREDSLERIRAAVPREFDRLLDALHDRVGGRALSYGNDFVATLVADLRRGEDEEIATNWFVSVVQSLCRRGDSQSLHEVLGEEDLDTNVTESIVLPEIDSLMRRPDDGSAFLRGLSLIDIVLGHDLELGFTERRFAELTPAAKRHVLLHGTRPQIEFVLTLLAASARAECLSLRSTAFEERPPVPSPGLCELLAQSATQHGRGSSARRLAEGLSAVDFRDVSLADRLAILAAVDELEEDLQKGFLSALSPANSSQIAIWRENPLFLAELRLRAEDGS